MFNKLQDELLVLKIHIDDISNQNNYLENKINNINDVHKTEIHKYNKKIIHFEKKIDISSIKLNEANDLINYLQDENRKLNIKLKHENYKYSTLEIEHNKLINKNSNITIQLNDTLDAYNERGDIIKHLTDDIRELKISSNKTIIELKNNIYNLEKMKL